MTGLTSFDYFNFKECMFTLLSEIKMKRKAAINNQIEIEKLMNEILILKCKLVEMKVKSEDGVQHIKNNKIESSTFENVAINEYEMKIQNFDEILKQNKEKMCSMQLENYKQSIAITNLESINNRLKSHIESSNVTISKLKDYILEISNKTKQLESLLSNINTLVQEYQIQCSKFQVTMKHYECIIKNYSERVEINEKKCTNLSMENEKLLFEIDKLTSVPMISMNDIEFPEKIQENIEFCLEIEKKFNNLTNRITYQTDQNSILRDEIVNSNNRISSLENQIKLLQQELLSKNEIIDSLENKISFENINKNET